eukprot:scaffold25825_cov131-Isochrysis_galbana.AAC.3
MCSAYGVVGEGMSCGGRLSCSGRGDDCFQPLCAAENPNKVVIAVVIAGAAAWRVAASSKVAARIGRLIAALRCVRLVCQTRVLVFTMPIGCSA